MLFKTLSISLALVSAVTAAPTSLNKKAGVQVIDNCYNSGQVALTFDGEYNLPTYTLVDHERAGEKGADYQMDHTSMRTKLRIDSGMERLHSS